MPSNFQAFTGTAVTAYKDGKGLLYQSARLRIVNGVVVEVEPLTRAPDICNLAIAKAVKALWSIIRSQDNRSIWDLDEKS